METSHLGIIFFIIILICIFKMKSENYQESFIVLDNEPIKGSVNDYSDLEHQGSPMNHQPYCPDKKCPFYLLHDGTNYIVFNHQLPIQNNINPKYFDTHNQAKDYITNLNCPIPKLRPNGQPKNNQDPTVNYERVCNKKIAGNNMGIDHCIYYAKDLSSLKKYYDTKQNDKNKSIFSYDQCMVDAINDELNVTDEADLNYKKMILDTDQYMTYKSI